MGDGSRRKTAYGRRGTEVETPRWGVLAKETFHRNASTSSLTNPTRYAILVASRMDEYSVRLGALDGRCCRDLKRVVCSDHRN